LDEPEKNEGGAPEELRGAPSRLTIFQKQETNQ
jgi:hypothetical protein